MSYDISLFDRGFLKRALATELGDWNGATPIADEVKETLISLAVAERFAPAPSNEDFSTFLRAQGVEPAREFEIDTPALLARLAIHSGQVAFTIPYSPRAQASIAFCARIAHQMASEWALGYYDPQEEVAEF
jgi:hypothetical protein